MDVLVDTNIFIHRESDDIVPEKLRVLERSIREEENRILVHPLSVKEILQDPNDQRREQAVSRIETYPHLSFSPTPIRDDSEFREKIPEADNLNGQVDNMLLYSVYENNVDFLITQDKEMHRKALDLGIQDRVFSIEEGVEFFTSEPPSIRVPTPIQRLSLGDVDLDDPFFDSLKDEYDDFVAWAKSKSDRPAWVSENPDGGIGAILVLKMNETENIGVDPPLGRETRLKISTLKVGESRWGSKLGELLISIAIREAINQELNEIYLTHYVKEEDYLVDLIGTWGFENVSRKSDGEAIFLKYLTPPVGANPDPTELAQIYYPSFYDGDDVAKFLVPIRPIYHNKLFTSYKKRDTPLREFDGEFLSEGNAIRKAYLSNSRTKKVDPGDILLFYRSRDEQEVTSIGVCQDVYYRLKDPDEISRIVGKRSVFSKQEIEDMANSPTTIFLFTWHFELSNPIPYDELVTNGVIAGPPQVIQELDEQGYEYMKQHGGVDGRFARH